MLCLHHAATDTVTTRITIKPRTGNLVAAIATIACCDIATGLTFQLLPLIMENRHVPAWIMGINAAMSPLGILVIGPFLPAITGRVGSKRLVYIVISVIVFCLLMFKLSPALWWWFFIRFVFGMAVGTLFTISEAWLLTFTEEGSRGRIMGLYTMVLSVSFALGPTIIPFTGIDGWTPWLIGVVSVAISALPLALIKVSESVFHEEKKGTFFRFVKRAPLLLFAVCSVTVFDSILLSFFPIFGLRSGLPLQTVSWVLAAGIIGNVVFQYPIGVLADKWSRLGVIVISALITTVLCVAMIWGITSILIWPIVLVAGSTAFGAYTVALTILGDHFSGSDLVAGSAAFGAMWGIGGIIGPPIAGFAVDLFGINAIPLCLAGIFAVLLLGLGVSGGQLVREVPHG